MKKTHIIIHHTAMYSSYDTREQFDAVNLLHRRRWNGKTKSKMNFYGGYHYIVERSGIVQQFRAEDEVGAHCNDGIKRIGLWRYSANYYAIGICFAGNMSRQELTPKQIETGVELIKDIRDRHSMIDANILPHRDFTPTQCPGNNIPDKVWAHLQELYLKLDNEELDIIKWHKKYKIIEIWNTPPTEQEIKVAWIIYKSMKATINNKFEKSDFNL